MFTITFCSIPLLLTAGGILSEQHYVLGYGSLMSHDSRLRHSDIDDDGLAVTVSGWQRAWNMSCSIEWFTCVGAVIPEDQGQTINGVLVPVAEISDKLKKREQNSI